MEYKMKLQNRPFEMIKSGIKTIEMRLNDEKRQLLRVGDFIEFTNVDNLDVLKVIIDDIQVYNNFMELYNSYSKESLGYLPDEQANSTDMELYYSREEQDKYGVMAIKVRVLKKQEN